MTKTVCIIQARMGSSRLPGKVLRPLGNKTVLGNVIHRIQKCKLIDGIVVATPDREIVQEAIAYGAYYYLGDENNVLERYYKAARMFNADRIVRITADCPYIMPDIVDKLIEKAENYSYGSNVISRTYPKGLDCEVFNYKELERAHKESDEREHVTPFIIKYAKQKYSLQDTQNNSFRRITLDTEQDYQELTNLYKYIGDIYTYEEAKQYIV